MSSAGLKRRAAYGALLRREHYVPFTLTVALARMSAMMFTTGGVLLVLSRTGNTALAGVTAAAAVLPGSLSGPVLGAWLDVARHRRLLIVIDQLLSVIGLLAIVALVGHAPDWTVPAVAVIYSITRPLSVGSFFSTLNEVVGVELIDTASTIEASSLNLAFLLGPALAGLLAGAASPAIAVVVQAGLTLVVAGLVAVNPVFELRSPHRAPDARSALRDGLRSIVASPLMLSVGVASVLASLGWGLMNLGFPLYAVHSLHVGAHNSGYLWAAVAGGSITGTFVLHGAPSRRRIALSYMLLGLSALLWPLAHVLTLGILLVGLTGFLEGPAYSGTITLRQRLAPPAVRGQVINTLAGANLVAVSAGSAIGGAIGHALPLILAFLAINLVAAAIVAGTRLRARLGG
ncbi:MAG TPA: MFS transporter [Solirubrobacteraceae bacterium]|nr:MFS transporter [Solirubrobacteraceae bacterium]